MNKLLFVLLFFSSFSFAELARINSGGGLTVNHNQVRTALKTESFSADQIKKLWVKSAEVNGEVVGTYGERIGGLRGTAISSTPARGVVALGLSKANVYVRVATLIAPPLIDAGFRQLDNNIDAGGDFRWWKETKDKRTIYYSYDMFFPSTKECGDKNICGRGDNPATSCPGGAARSASQTLLCYKWGDDGWGGKGWVVDGNKAVGAYQDNLEPASDGELIDALMLRLGAINSLPSALAASGHQVTGSEALSLQAYQTLYSDPYTPSTSSDTGTAGQPQQTQVSTDGSGNATVSYSGRPDLKPNSPEAPSKDPNPQTEGEISKENGNEKPTKLEIEFPNHCDINPNTLGCAEYDDVPKLDVDFEEEDVGGLSDDRFKFQAVCPAPVVFNIFGRQYYFRYDPLCNIMIYIQPLIIVLALIKAFFMLSRSN